MSVIKLCLNQENRIRFYFPGSDTQVAAVHQFLGTDLAHYWYTVDYSFIGSNFAWRLKNSTMHFSKCQWTIFVLSCLLYAHLRAH